MNKKGILIVAAIAALMALALCGCDQTPQTTGKEAPKVGVEADQGGKKPGGGAVVEATDPPPPAEAKGKGVAFGAKSGGQ